MQEPPKGRTATAGVLAFTMGLLGAMGWALHAPRLTAILADGASMKLNTALALVALGLGLSLPRLRTPLAALAAMLAGLSLAEFVLGVDLGIDQALVRDLVTPVAQHPGRTSPSTALALLLVAGAMISRRSAPSQWMSIGAFLVSADAVVIHAYSLGLSGVDTGMALQTGIGALAASIGATPLSLGPGPLSVFASPYQGGRLTRRVLPPLGAALVAVGWLTARGVSGTALRPGLWIAGQTIATCTAFGVAAWWYARGLNVEDKRREAATRELAETNSGLERRVAERTADLQASNEALNGFMYHVAHDLRAPLRSIASTSRIVMEDYEDVLPDEAVGQLVRQAKAATKLGTLIDDLLRLSKLAQQAVERAPIDLTKMAREVAEESLSAHPGTSVRVDVQEGLEAWADPRLLRLALGNLVENAVKYSPEGGTVRVGRRPDGAYFVSDEGIGIDPRYFGKVFEPFQRLHSDEEFSGTGIGLSNVKQVMERHGGKIWVESEPPRGSTFLFTLD